MHQLSNFFCTFTMILLWRVIRIRKFSYNYTYLTMQFVLKKFFSQWFTWVDLYLLINFDSEVFDITNNADETNAETGLVCIIQCANISVYNMDVSKIRTNTNRRVLCSEHCPIATVLSNHDSTVYCRDWTVFWAFFEGENPLASMIWSA